MGSTPPTDCLKGTIPLEEAIIEEIKDAGRPFAFAVMNGEEHMTIAAKNEAEKTKWISLLHTLSKSCRAEANKEKIRILSQIGSGGSSPGGKLLKQTSRLQKSRSLTPKQLAPMTTGDPLNNSSDDDSEMGSAPPEALKPRPISYDRSRSPSPTPPVPPPRPLSKAGSTPPPLSSSDPDEIFQQALLSAVVGNSADSSKDYVLEAPDLTQLTAEQAQEEKRQREAQLLVHLEEQRQLELERRNKEKEIEEKTHEIESKLPDYRRTTFREIAKTETEKAEFERLKTTMTEREAAYFVAAQGENSTIAKEIISSHHQHHTTPTDDSPPENPQPQLENE